MTSINIGKVIYNILANDETLTTLVNKRIFPLVAEQGTLYPFIIYRRTNIDTNSNKDENGEIIYVELNIVSNNYQNSVEVAEQVRKILEHKSGTYSEIEIDDIEINSASEEFSEDGFIQNITLKITI